MISFTFEQWQFWIASLIWPLSRVLGLIAAAPILGSVSAPASVKVGLGVLLSIMLSGVIDPIPNVALISMAGLFILMQQVIIGLAMGFVMRIAFAAVEMAGEVSSLTMGLGFAIFFDPQTRAHTSAVSQFLALLTTLLFLVLDCHLLLFSILAQSFESLPLSRNPWGGKGFYELVKWSGVIFVTGLHLALPLIAAILLANIALGILTRSAPQLNLFGIGFPITLGLGFVTFLLLIPRMQSPIEQLFAQALRLIKVMINVSVS